MFFGFSSIPHNLIHSPCFKLPHSGINTSPAHIAKPS
ncbi:hypothetical protein OROHE_022011 [Orobanche hederae]